MNSNQDSFAGPTMKVFLVDDSLAIRQRLTKMLSGLKGVQVIGEAQAASAATHSILQLRPDVVILDLQLVTGTGFDVLKSIKKETSAPTVIVLTNFPYPQYRKKCLDAGADFFFDKSTEFHNIPRVFEQLTQQARNRRQTTPRIDVR